MGDEQPVERSVVDAALARASDEFGLAEYYRDCVRPLLRSGASGFPQCCGGSCEPCNQTLVNVAERVLLLLGRERVP